MEKKQKEDEVQTIWDKDKGPWGAFKNKPHGPGALILFAFAMSFHLSFYGFQANLLITYACICLCILQAEMCVELYNQ